MIKAIAESESSKGSPRYTITVLSESSKIYLNLFVLTSSNHVTAIVHKMKRSNGRLHINERRHWTTTEIERGRE